MKHLKLILYCFIIIGCNDDEIQSTGNTVKSISLTLNFKSDIVQFGEDSEGNEKWDNNYFITIDEDDEEIYKSENFPYIRELKKLVFDDNFVFVLIKGQNDKNTIIRMAKDSDEYKKGGYSMGKGKISKKFANDPRQFKIEKVNINDEIGVLTKPNPPKRSISIFLEVEEKDGAYNLSMFEDEKMDIPSESKLLPISEEYIYQKKYYSVEDLEKSFGNENRYHLKLDRENNNIKITGPDKTKSASEKLWYFKIDEEIMGNAKICFAYDASEIETVHFNSYLKDQE